MLHCMKLEALELVAGALPDWLKHPRLFVVAYTFIGYGREYILRYLPLQIQDHA